MNKIYKLKYDRRRNQLVAVSELTTGAGKEATGSVAGLQGVSTFRRLLGTLTPLAVLTGLVIGMLPGLALANPDLPVGGQVVAGQGSISTSGNQMTIHQGTHGLVTNWHSFDIGQNHTVQFVQPDSSAVALNRVTGGHESQILGALTANGQVMLVNPAGVMFGKGAKVNTAGLLASTKNISTEDFMAGRYTFSGGSHPGAEIVNQGSLTTTKGGYIVLAADRVRNSGTLSTPSGKTVLTAADRVTLQLDNTGLASVSVNGSVVNALVENSGLIAATNGQVYLTARGKDMLLNTVVNNSGTVEARGLNQRGGEIVLDGGESGVVSQSGMLLADSETGRGGKITVQGANIHLAGGSRTSATGRTGGGGVYVGGGWQGKDAAIRNASKVVMDKSATIDVSATESGNGGSAVLWSDDYTNFRGTILAKGGAQSGNGGQVETSSHHNLQAFGGVDASALNGRGGNWLLDPFDISIVGGSTDTNINEGVSNNGIFTPDAGGSQVSNSTINARLNGGTNVTIKTAKENSGSNQWGNITVNADISHTASNNVSLTLNADGNINITNHNITSSSGKLDVNLSGAGSHDGTITLNNASITTNGGNITLGQPDSSTSGGLNISITNKTVLNAAAASNPSAATNGNITLTANNGMTLSNASLKGNNVTINASSGASDALVINSASSLTADTSLTVTGETSATGSHYGIHTWGNSSFSAGGTLTMTGNASSGTDGAFNASAVNVSAINAVIKGTSTGNGIGIKVDSGLNNTLSGGSLQLEGTVTGTGGGTAVQLNATVATNGTGNLLVSGKVVKGTGVKIAGGNLTGGNITVNGSTSDGTSAGVALSGMNMNATGNISVSGKGFDSSGGALSVTGNNTFSAQNTVLSGEAGRNNVGTLLGGKLNVTRGNLSVTGTSHHYSSGSFRGLKANGLNLTVSSGSLSLTGKSVEFEGRGPQSGAVAGLELINVSLSADSASLTGSSVDSGSGFTLNNVTLSGGIAQGNNMTFSSQGSDVNVTNTLNVNGGLGYGAFEAIRGAGIDNNTSVGVLTASQADMQKYLNFRGATSDWVFDVGSLGGATGGKAGVWSVAGFTGINATTTGNISLIGMSLTDSNLTGSSVTLQGEDNASLILQNTTLNATSGNVSLSADGNINLSGESIGASKGSVNIQAGGVNGTAGGNALTVSNVSFTSQNGTTLSGLSAQNGTGVKLNGAINVTQGNLAVNGSTTRVDNGIEVRGIDARNTNISVSGTNAVLNMTGTVNGDTDATLSPSVVGLDLGGNSVLNASSANLKGVSTGKGMGFILNASLSDSLKSTTGNNLTLSSKGSDYAVHNYIGNRVDDGFVKHLIDADTRIGSKTEVQKVDIYKQKLTDIINASTNSNDLTKDFGEWILSFSNITINKGGNISFTGASFSNSTLTAGGNLTLDNGPGNLSLSGSQLTATNGYVNLTGGSGINLANGNISANTDITINASNGGVTISGKNNSSGMAGVTSTSGNISIYGNATERAQSGVSLTNARLSAEKGGINVKGDTDAAGDPYKYTSKGGVSLSGTVNFSSTSNTVYGHNSHSLNAATGGFVVNNDGAYTFSGNTSINGVGEQGYGVVFYVTSSTATFNFKSGEYYSFDGSGVVGTYMPPYAYGAKQIKFNVEEGTLNFSGKGTNGSGISGNDYSSFNSGYLFSGNGSVNIKGSSESGAGVDSRYLNNTGLTGCFTVTGESQSGTGVVIVYNTDWNVQNATITGTSATGTGINISGNKLHITNVTLNGTSGGSGSGVQLTGGTNYSIDGVTINGQSQAGNGVSVGGNLSVSNGTVSGTTATGSGVDIGGDLNTVNTTITGNASGNGSGVSLNGNVTGDLTEKNMITGHSGQGNGVLVSGNSTATNVTLNGDTVDGNGIKVTGNLMTDNVVASGNATGNGSGISLAGNVTGGHWTGNSSPGTGVSVSEDSTLSDVTLSGITATGTGVNVAGNLTNAGGTTVTGNATGNGTGASVSGTLNGNISGDSDAGTGAAVNGTVNGTVSGTTLSGTGAAVGDGANLTQGQVHGNATSGTGSTVTGSVTGGTVTGSATTGTGMNVTGDSTLTNVTLSGTTASGNGVNVAGNLTSAGSTTVTGNATGNGTGLHLLPGSSVSGGQLSGESVSGPGSVLDGSNHLLSTTLTGSSGVGSGLLLNGMVTNTDSVLHGQSGSGDGVSLNGTVTGGSLSGQSEGGAGIHVTGNSSVSGVNVSASSGSGQGLQLDGVLSTAGGTTLNGAVQGDSSAERREVYELQNRLSHNNRSLKQVVATSGYREQEKPVVVEVCTDGESSCRHLDAGTPDRPLHP